MKKILSFLLTIMLIVSAVPLGAFEFNVSAEIDILNDDNFTHLAQVPEGYIGIYTKEDLRNIDNNLENNYILMNDIEFTAEDFSSTGNYYNDGNGWAPIGSSTAFSGVFDGNGYAIKNLLIDASVESTITYIGLFGHLSGTVKKLRVTGQIEVTNKSSISIYAGSIAGKSTGTVEDCVSECTIKSSDKTSDYITYKYIGGIIGYSSGSLENCINNGVITAQIKPESRSKFYGYIGGICGYVKGSISDCSNLGEITIQANAGEDDTISVYYYAGGISGYLDGNIVNSDNSGNIKATDLRDTINHYSFYVSGIAANTTQISNISNCFNEADMYSVAYKSFSAGIVSKNAGVISRCYNFGKIYSSDFLYEKGDFTYFYSGGIAAESSGAVSECYNTGIIDCLPMGSGFEEVYAGGIVAKSVGQITNCYNTGNVSGDMFAGYGGGIAGYSSGTVSFCYGIGCTGEAASVIGYAQSAPTNCYGSELSSFGVNVGRDTVIQYTLQQMQDKNNFANFDFENVWQINANSDYPYPTLLYNEHTIPENQNNTIEFAGGNGSFVKPYLISTAEHFENIKNYSDCFFKLINDVDFKGKSEWVFINFLGYLDGNGFAVKNFSSTKYSLLDYNYGYITNLALENANVSRSGICFYNYGKITNCSFSGNALLGGIAYDTMGPIVNCFNEGNITGGGGIVGRISGTTSDAGSWNGYVENCYNAGNITGTGNIGGIAGVAEQGDIKNCYNIGSVYSDKNAGGIVGSLIQADIVNCYNIGAVTCADGGSKGALIGSSDSGYAEDCYFLDNMTAACPSDLISATVLTYDQMTKADSFEDFDFRNTWTMDGNESYLLPELQNVKMIFEKKVISIEITTKPTKLQYNENEKFDNSGMIVVAHYNDGTTSQITDYVVEYDFSSGGNKNVNINYDDITTTFYVTVMHTVSSECDTICNVCKATIVSDKPHTYENACDSVCNGCGETRTPSAHKYDNTCDTTCNECSAVRIITHTYSNDCDIECNVCGETRTVPDHVYNNNCDTTCNECGDVRNITHTYSNNCDAECNVCGYTRTPSAHVYDHIYDVNCNVCGAAREAAPLKWEISVSKTGVYSLKPNSKYTGVFSTDKIIVSDKNGNQVKFNESKGGYPLVADQDYIVKFNYDCSDDINGTVTWTKTRKAETIFSDVSASEWYNNAIIYAVGRGIINGYGGTNNFGPGDNIQRQDFMVILARLDGVDLDNYNYKSRFPDVERGSYYEAAVNWGAEKGIVNGYDNGKFGVGDKVTREQLVTFLYRYAQYKECDSAYTNDREEIVSATYTDYKNVSGFAKDAILWAIEKGVISGKNEYTIAPHGNAQRCEVAKIMYNIYLNDIF